MIFANISLIFSQIVIDCAFLFANVRFFFVTLHAKTKLMSATTYYDVMISNEEIRALLTDLESDRVERTISTTNTDKFGQVICAFANDLPNNRKPGYLFLGVNDDGSIHSIDVADELLKNVAAIRTDGNIQPQPSMVVEKISFPEGDIVAVEVQPHVFPPVQFRARGTFHKLENCAQGTY